LRRSPATLGSPGEQLVERVRVWGCSLQTQPRGAVKDTAASKKEMAQKSKEVERAGELLDSVQSAIEKTDVAATKKGGLFGLFGR